LQLVATLNLCPFKVRVIWDTGISKVIRGKHGEEAIFRRANHLRIGAGIDWGDDRRDLSQTCGVETDFILLREKNWSYGTDGNSHTQKT